MMMTFACNWWALVLRGIFTILFGLMVFVWPSPTLLSLTTVFGFYALLDGTFAMTAAWSHCRHRRRWIFLLEGLLGMAAGVVALVWPTMTVAALLSIMATWVILTGFLEIVTAIHLRHEIENEWLLGLGWLVSLILAVFLVIWPGAGLIALSWLFGAYALTFGILMLMFGFRLHLLHKLSEYGIDTF